MNEMTKRLYSYNRESFDESMKFWDYIYSTIRESFPTVYREDQN